MENLIIKNVEEKPTAAGKYRALLTDSTNKVYSIWDESITKTAMSLIGHQVSVEVSVKGDYANIKNLAKLAQNEAPTKNNFVPSIRDDSIVAQCLTKCTSEIVSSIVDMTKESLPLAMNAVGKQVYRQYRKFLTQLQHNSDDEEEEQAPEEKEFAKEG